jgi:hypothetical protein
MPRARIANVSNRVVLQLTLSVETTTAECDQKIVAGQPIWVKTGLNRQATDPTNGKTVTIES